MIFKHIKNDLPASLVVFLVALPLCLGIAMASGAPLFGGIVSGIIGGIVVGALSGSHLSVSGPAAGLTIIVFRSIETLGTYEAFLMAVFVAGILQILFGVLRAGTLSSFFPHSVIKGMLAAIGIILIMKQIPHAVGYDPDYMGDEAFFQFDGHNTFTEIFQAIHSISLSAVIVSGVSILILLAWETNWVKKWKISEFIPGALIAVIWGMVFNIIAQNFFPSMAIVTSHLVSLPEMNGIQDFIANMSFPDFSQINNVTMYKIAVTIAIIASIESLLSVEAIDRIDPDKRTTPQNKELFAQGCGNMACGLIGGIPLTAVIVRSSANLNAGAKTKLSCILHGVFLLVAVLFLAQVLNLIPLAALAAILLQVGYKLTKPALYKETFHHGTNQFIPFFITIVAILFTDLLVGIMIGIAVGLIFVLRTNYQESISLTQHNNNYLLRFNKDIFFLNKPELRNKLDKIPDGAVVLIDATRAGFIDHDVLESLEDFIESGESREMDIEIRKTHNSRYPIFRKNDEE